MRVFILVKVIYFLFMFKWEWSLRLHQPFNLGFGQSQISYVNFISTHFPCEFYCSDVFFGG